MPGALAPLAFRHRRRLEPAGWKDALARQPVGVDAERVP
jgi:hypothetical protein